MPTARVLDALHALVRPTEDTSDGDCLQRFLAHRDEVAFAELVRRHGPTVYGACRRILGGGPEADDAFQATFFVLARKAGSIRTAAAVAGWLYAVAVKVAHKARVQAVKRRVRQMAAAKPEAVHPPTPEADLWAVLDEELARLPAELRQAVLACDVGGKSRSQAARDLGWPEGTVAKRLAKGREALAKRLTRRGISLSVGALSIALCERATAAVPGALLTETARQATAFAAGSAGSLAAQALAEGVLRSLKVGAFKVWAVVGLLAMTLAGGSLMSANGPGGGDEKKAEPPPAAAKPEAAKAGGVWKESYVLEYTGALPVSVAYAPDGQTLLTGDTTGEVMAVTFPDDRAVYRWKAKVGGSHPAVAYSTDGKTVYATTEHGVRALDAKGGKETARIEAENSNPTAIGVFPDKAVPGGFRSQIVFGNVTGYFVKSWATDKPADTMGAIETKTGGPNADGATVPLAVDPKGRSAIMTGPVDPKTNKNVLWAYVCGDHGEGSPGNRVMEGHTAAVVSAAWAKEGGTAATGDAAGRVIVWDAKAMKESRRLDLGGRVAALAISDDGARTAAYVLGKHGGVYVWDTATPPNAMRPIHADATAGGPTSFASLSFSPDGKRLAGCAGDKKALTRLGELVGKARVWELAAEPKAQAVPKPAYTVALPRGSSANVVVLNNESMVVPADTEGAIDFRSVADGHVQFRLTLGKFAVGGLKLSADRRWLAMEHHPPAADRAGAERTTFDVGVWDVQQMKLRATVPACERTLAIAADGAVVAVRREKAVEVWDAVAGKKRSAAPFQTTRIDAAALSPDGKLLAVSDRNDLVLWRWEDGTHERLPLGRCVGSLAFSPDGRFLAEGPTPREDLQIRDVASRAVVQTLSNGTKRSMNVPRMVYAQGGRVLIACDDGTVAKELAVPHRITLWDTATGGVAHQIATPAGLPANLDVTPNGRYLVAAVVPGANDGYATTLLAAWRLDGGTTKDAPAAPPAAATPAGKVMWKEGQPIPLDRWPASALAVSPDGKMLAVAAANTVSIFDPVTGARLDKGRVANFKAPAARVGVAFSPSGKLAVTCQNGVAVFDDLLGEVPHFFGGPNLWEGVAGFDPHQVVFLDEVKPADWSDSKDARLVATNGATFKELGWAYTNRGGRAGWDRHAGETWESWESYRGRPTLLAAAAGTNRVIYAAGPAAAGEPDAYAVHVRLTDQNPHAVRTMAGHVARPTAGAVSPDGKLFLTGDEAGYLIAWDGATFQQARRWKLGGTVAAVALAADDATAAVLIARDGRGGTDWELYLFDATRPAGPLPPLWKTDAPLPLSPARAAALAFHPDGTRLYGVFGEPARKTPDGGWQKPVGVRVWERSDFPAKAK